jgi:hypothetical protein
MAKSSDSFEHDKDESAVSPGHEPQHDNWLEINQILCGIALLGGSVFTTLYIALVDTNPPLATVVKIIAFDAVLVLWWLIVWLKRR